MKKLLILAAFILLGCKQNLQTNETSEETVVIGADWDCSMNIGEHPCNFTLKDQNNKDVELYDFYGEFVILDFSVEWCGPCQAAASGITETKQKYPNINYITILVENISGEEPSISNLQAWANSFGISEPVLKGSRDILQPSDPNGWPIGSWPTFFYINDEMELEYAHGGYSEYTLNQNIEALLSD